MRALSLVRGWRGGSPPGIAAIRCSREERGGGKLIKKRRVEKLLSLQRAAARGWRRTKFFFFYHLYKSNDASREITYRFRFRTIPPPTLRHVRELKRKTTVALRFERNRTYTRAPPPRDPGAVVSEKFDIRIWNKTKKKPPFLLNNENKTERLNKFRTTNNKSERSACYYKHDVSSRYLLVHTRAGYSRQYGATPYIYIYISRRSAECDSDKSWRSKNDSEVTHTHTRWSVSNFERAKKNTGAVTARPVEYLFERT